MIALPADDFTLSPFTGWTRAHWTRVADTVLDGAARHASPAGSLIRYPGGPGPLGSDVDHLEGFARTFMLAAFRIAGDPAGTQALAERYARGIAAGVDRTHPERWVRPDEHGQAKVEAAALALGLHLTRRTVWARLSDRTREQLIEYLATFIGAPYPPNNWAWFRITVEQFLESVDGPFSARDREEDFALLDSFDLPGGWIADGVGRNFDHYCGWALPFYPIFWADMVGDAPAHAERIARYTARLDDYLDDALHLIGADGGPLIQGRSLTYRFATAGAAWAAAFHGRSRHDLGVLRRAASGQVRHFVDRGMPDADGILPIGWHHAWPAIAQNYSGPGSPYWAAKGMAGLALPAEHPVWAATEQPLPIERHSFIRALTAPGWVAVGTSDDGVVRITNHGTDHRVEGDLQPDAPTYAKFGYSTATAPVLAGGRVVDPLDGTVSIVRNGRASHRSGFTPGGVRILDASTAVGASSSQAHWPLDLTLAPDHGVTVYTARTETGPLVDTVSAVHGAWEVRLIRIRPDGLAADDLLRVGGWALTAPDARSLEGAWASTERLASRVVPLIAAEAGTQGVTDLGDATPLEGSALVPWVETAARADGWVAVAVGLGSPGALAVAPTADAEGKGIRIHWPDGAQSLVDPATWTVPD